MYDGGTGEWQQQAYLKAWNTDGGDKFGHSVSIDGDLIAVSAPEEDNDATGIKAITDNDNATGSGAVYLFERTGDTWSQVAYVKASNAEAGDEFGGNNVGVTPAVQSNFATTVSLSGNALLVGAPTEQSSAREIDGAQDNDSAPFGAGYLFEHIEGSWQQTAYIKPSNLDNSDFFGTSVALDGNYAVVGAYSEESQTTDPANNDGRENGAAYVFLRTP